jgi:pseudouridine-5'-monophosphatase
MGLPRMDLARRVISDLQIPIPPEQYIRETIEIQETLFPGAKLLPGAEKLINHLVKSGVPIALATSSPRDSYLIKTQAHQELFSKFLHTVNGSDDPEVKRGKPSPDIFIVGARRFSSPPLLPGNCLVFEDSPAGVNAALSAGMKCVMVPDSRMFDTPEFIPPGVTKVIRTLDQFLPEEFGLPGY